MTEPDGSPESVRNRLAAFLPDAIGVGSGGILITAKISAATILADRLEAVERVRALIDNPVCCGDKDPECPWDRVRTVSEIRDALDGTDEWGDGGRG
jgi:hypothetical protein